MAAEFLAHLPLRLLDRNNRLIKLERETRCQLTLRTNVKRAKTQAQSPFCRLPPELKNAIYELVFKSGEIKLLHTCRAIWLEAHNLAIHLHTFGFRFTNLHEKRSNRKALARFRTEQERMQKFFNSLTLRNRVEVNKVRLCVSHEDLRRLADKDKVLEFFGGKDRVVYAKQLVICVRDRHWDYLEQSPQPYDDTWVWNMLYCNALRMLCLFQIELEVYSEDDHYLYPFAEWVTGNENARFVPASTTEFLMETHLEAEYPLDINTETETSKQQYSRITVTWQRTNGNLRARMQKKLQTVPVTKDNHDFYMRKKGRGGRRAHSATNKTRDLPKIGVANFRDPKQEHMWEALDASAAYLEKWERSGSLLTLVAGENRRARDPGSDKDKWMKYRQEEKLRKKKAKSRRW